MKYVGLITARTSSSRLKNKCLLEIGHKLTVIEHIILRCINADIEPIICTTKNKSDQKLVNIAKKFKIKSFRGSEKNKIKRWYDCSTKFKINNFHTIDADDLYFDPDAIKKSLDLVRLKTLDIVHPSKHSRYGGASEGYSFTKKGIKKLYLSLYNYKFNRFNNLDTEMIDIFVENANLNSYLFKGQSYAIKSKIRLTLDYIEDFKLFKKIFKHFGTYSTRKEINDFLKKNKNILKINYFRNKQWDTKQKNFKIPKKK